MASKVEVVNRIELIDEALTVLQDLRRSENARAGRDRSQGGLTKMRIAI